MTKDKKRKQATRARMAKTGESYQAAHRATHPFATILQCVIQLAEARMKVWQAAQERLPKGVGPLGLRSFGSVKDDDYDAFGAPEHVALLTFTTALSPGDVRKLLAFMYAGAYGDSILALREHLVLTFPRHDLAVEQLLGRERVSLHLQAGLKEAARQGFDLDTAF